MTLTLPETELPELPAAVEVAAYRIAVEAALNVIRHSGVRAATLELAVEEGSLRLSVTDAGRGTGDAPAGVGVLAMRERAEEVGGTLEVTDTGAGTRVEALLPVPVTTAQHTGAER